MLRRLFLAVPALLLGAVVAHAQQEPRDGWTLGLSVVGDTNPYLGQGSDVLALPLIAYRSGPFAISTNGVEYRLLRNGPFSLTVAARPRFSGLISTDGAQLDGIDREVTGDVALEAVYDIGRFYADGAIRQEFTGEHDGQELRLGVGTRQRLGAVGLSLNAGAAWQSEDLSQYIWGVSASEVAVGRPAYAPGNVLVPYLSIGARLPINDNLSLLGTIRADFLPSEVTDSPIIEDDTLISGGLGFVYRF